MLTKAWCDQAREKNSLEKWFAHANGARLLIVVQPGTYSVLRKKAH